MPAPDLPPTRWTPWRWLFWEIIYQPTWLWFKICYRVRTVHRGPRIRTIPGPVLIVCNHQSFFDPQLIGVFMGARRRIYMMARDTLWRIPLVGWGIRWLNAIPVSRTEDGGGGQKKTMQHCIAVLEAGNTLAIFPEGTRTPDGGVGEFSPGIMLIIKRARPTVVPCAIDGAFDVWPRQRSKPRLTGRMSCTIGEPIDADTLIAMRGRAVPFLQESVTALR